MKIYVVTSGDWSDYGIDQIFLTKEKADLYASAHKGSRVEEYETYDNKINENNIYYIYTADYFPETGEFYVLPVNVEEYYEGIEKLERYYHTPRKVFKKRIELEEYRIVFIDTKKFDEEKIKKIFFDKLMVYKAKEEGIN